jgi:lipopolysaccharide transport system permease protein
MLWAVFHPLTIIFVYTVIFSELMKSKLTGMENTPFAYSMYLCSGVLTCFFLLKQLHVVSMFF